MGFLTNTKNSTIVADAKAAMDEGASTFCAVLNYPSLNTGNSAGIDAWSGEISAVEALGWKLKSWAVSADRRGNLIAFPVFQR